MKSQKVFCIGFQKTGTSSLGLALEKLGYRVAGYYPFRDMAHQDGLTMAEVEQRAIEVMRDFDAAQDTPWPVLYRELDAAFPGSKFIHISRGSDAWLNSATNDFNTFPNQIHNLIYGSPFPIGHEADWLARYDRHNAEVRAYFADRPDDFISLELEKGEVNWDKICGFLGVPVPNIPWPHANKRQVKKYKLIWWRMLRRLGLDP
ncbi:sulfotransferase family protein [Actibacterium sp. XHP0104]|uniref:sulfotransferase family protein n=1 Tax=Actibacterium sp. XHP0104 TaxID=2984335 RepID=UPI0021E81C63|nr:sulfotransferase family protein [Actibacterium sp. XHP0104]MCV2881874.1 sulfotransferase family protein [Actibacterium sp. XHP0104]